MYDAAPLSSDRLYGLPRGAERRFDGLYAAERQAQIDLDLAGNSTYSGAAYEVEGRDVGSEASATMYQMLNANNGEPNPAVMSRYVDDLDASDYDTDLTSMEALARNARYADQVGVM